MDFNETGDYISPSHSSSTTAQFPQWFEPAPKTHSYPWTNLMLPVTKNVEVSCMLCNHLFWYIVHKSKHSFLSNNYYNVYCTILAVFKL